MVNIVDQIIKQQIVARDATSLLFCRIYQAIESSFSLSLVAELSSTCKSHAA
jgi:hypothetical protein